MKFTNIKSKTLYLVIALLTLISSTAPVSASTTEQRTARQYQQECGKKIGVLWAFAIFKKNDTLTFLDYVNLIRKTVHEYADRLENQAVVNKVFDTLNKIEEYITKQQATNSAVSAQKVGKLLTKLKAALPDHVIESLDKAFSEGQMKLMQRNKPLSVLDILPILNKKLNPK